MEFSISFLDPIEWTTIGQNESHWSMPFEDSNRYDDFCCVSSVVFCQGPKSHSLRFHVQGYVPERLCSKFRENPLVDFQSSMSEIFRLQIRDLCGWKPPISPFNIKSEAMNFRSSAEKHFTLEFLHCLKWRRVNFTILWDLTLFNSFVFSITYSGVAMVTFLGASFDSFNNWRIVNKGFL